MEYKVKLQEFAPALTDAEVAAEVARIKELSVRNYRKEVYAFALSAVDLTTLTCNDSVAPFVLFENDGFLSTSIIYYQNK